MRIDKLLSNMGVGSRKEVKALMKKKKVFINGVAVKSPNTQVNPEKDQVICDGKVIKYQKYGYWMLHKPSGYLSATYDHHQRTVIDLLDEKIQIFEPFPVGRLDKDTEGLLLLTNDGQLAHKLLSPKNHIEKTYIAKVDQTLTSTDVEQLEQGVDIGEGVLTQPATVKVMSDEEPTVIQLTITEGKFHQVKRMFHAVDKKVTYLKRMSMGGLVLDELLTRGAYRELTQKEIEWLQEL
ncbi:pseudouridine synthase [Gracilibacillus halophilus YIM-C55.5]|uniref:Pseudouridine synthase n=1 Tax=Gracilibacillus halophilus YIM-C55.5 TaxID=1308866 RepID=N4WMQ7_9BACI|nr:pseudouridine synthase [Gracilibacillus halophilus]ENH95805.1 pseudouridine synthase [Gracilibacillus halophilus YIM-C55.5]